MSSLMPISAPPRRRHVPYRRWSAEEKAACLDAFQRSGVSGAAFCRETGVPYATFALWKREARRLAPPTPTRRERTTGVGFARVVASPNERGSGLRVVVRGGGGHVAELDMVDAQTVLRVIALVLGTRGRVR